MIILENANPKELSPAFPKKKMIQKNFVVTKLEDFDFDLAHLPVAITEGRF